MNANELAKRIVSALEDKKAEDIKIIDISNISVIADYFIIAGGSNRNQVQALADHVDESCGKAGHPVKRFRKLDSDGLFRCDRSYFFEGGSSVL